MLMGAGDSDFALMSMVVVVGMPMLVLVVLGVMFVIVLTSVITLVFMLVFMFVFVLAIFRVCATNAMTKVT